MRFFKIIYFQKRPIVAPDKVSNVERVRKDVMLMTRMTDKQKKFADEYLIDLNATRAYKVAYPNVKKDDSARVNASRLLTKAYIREYIDEQLQKLHDERMATTENVLLYLSDVLNGKSKSSVLSLAGNGYQEVIEKPPDERERLKAAELLGKYYGMWQKNVTVKDESAEKQKAAISNIESLVKQMVPVKDDDISE